MSSTDLGSGKSVNGVLEENTAIGNGLTRTISETQASPRVSTVGTDDPSTSKKDQHAFFAPEVTQEEFRDYSAPGLDSLHWAGVKKRGDFDQRSVASSMNAEKDDKSIYEEPAVGAVEEAEEDLDEDDEDEEPEEIVLGGIGQQRSDSVVGIQESGPISQDGFEQENMSPRETEQNMAESSVAPSEADAASIRPVPSEDGELEDVSLDHHNAGPISGQQAVIPGSSAAPSSAASPRSTGLPPSPLSRASAEFEAMHFGSPAAAFRPQAIPRPIPASAGPGQEQYRSSLMRKVTGTGAGTTDDTEDDLDTSASVIASDGNSVAPSLPDSSAFQKDSYSMSPPREPAGVLSASVASSVAAEQAKKEDEVVVKEEQAEEAQVEKEEEKEGEIVETEATAAEKEEITKESAQEQPAPEEPAPAAAADDEEQEEEAVAASIDLPAETPIEPLEVEAPAAATAAAVAAPSSAVQPQQSPPVIPRVDMGPEWENTFKGLLYIDGLDALGRPVVVLNADAVPPRMKSAALTYVKAHLEPLVNAGHYVIVFTARKAKLPSLWIMGAYQTLPRPYRKNVQYVILVKPSGFLKAVLAFMRPFVSNKAGRKIKAVENLEEIGEATGGEVTVQHLGRNFLEADAAVVEEERAAAEAAAAVAAGP